MHLLLVPLLEELGIHAGTPVIVVGVVVLLVLKRRLRGGVGRQNSSVRSRSTRYRDWQ